MKFTNTEIEGLVVMEPRVFEDNRGYFYESFNLNAFQEHTGNEIVFVQDNHSLSQFGVMRGLHFQFGQFAQAKLVRVLRGKVLDVVVDIRKESPTYGKTFSIELSEDNKLQLFVPRGFAHGFITLSETAEFCYKCDNFYSPQHESGIIYNDTTLGIDWKLSTEQLIVSEKDLKLSAFNHQKYSFE